MQFFILAHGALGIWDEVIFLGVAILFLVFMGISWVRSRAMPPTMDDTSQTPTSTPAPEDDDAHFRLD